MVYVRCLVYDEQLVMLIVIIVVNFFVFFRVFGEVEFVFFQIQSFVFQFGLRV